MIINNRMEKAVAVKLLQELNWNGDIEEGSRKLLEPVQGIFVDPNKDLYLECAVPVHIPIFKELPFSGRFIVPLLVGNNYYSSVRSDLIWIGRNLRPGEKERLAELMNKRRAAFWDHYGASIYNRTNIRGRIFVYEVIRISKDRVAKFAVDMVNESFQEVRRSIFDLPNTPAYKLEEAQIKDKRPIDRGYETFRPYASSPGLAPVSGEEWTSMFRSITQANQIEIDSLTFS